jgi:hypothetical protein
VALCCAGKAYCKQEPLPTTIWDILKLFALGQSHELYLFIQNQIGQCAQFNEMPCPAANLYFHPFGPFGGLTRIFITGIFAFRNRFYWMMY